MRALLTGMIFAFLQTAAQAQDSQPQDNKAAPAPPAACFYSLVTGETINVPVGATVCRRSPPPYDNQYALLKCGPPLDEVASSIKRGDARCDRYEDRP